MGKLKSSRAIKRKKGGSVSSFHFRICRRSMKPFPSHGVRETVPDKGVHSTYINIYTHDPQSANQRAERPPPPLLWLW